MSEGAQLMIDWNDLNTGWSSYFPWLITYKGDQAIRILADRHYSRQTIGAKQFTRPGTNLVLRTADAKAVWVSWKTKFLRKDGYNAIECTIFRNESEHLSSTLIKTAIHATLKEWGELPGDGIITYVDDRKVNSVNPGYCFIRAGFKKVGRSSKGLALFQLTPERAKLMLDEFRTAIALSVEQYFINFAMECGEFMEAYDSQEKAKELEEHLLLLHKEMKNNRMKAWSDYEYTLEREDLDFIIGPY